MPVVIEELSASFQVRDEVKIRRVVRDEIERYMNQDRNRGGNSNRDGGNPADPGAGGGPNEGAG
jgi:hypothetical protein